MRLRDVDSFKSWRTGGVNKYDYCRLKSIISMTRNSLFYLTGLGGSVEWMHASVPFPNPGQRHERERGRESASKSPNLARPRREMRWPLKKWSLLSP